MRYNRRLDYKRLLVIGLALVITYSQMRIFIGCPAGIGCTREGRRPLELQPFLPNATTFVLTTKQQISKVSIDVNAMQSNVTLDALSTSWSFDHKDLQVLAKPRQNKGFMTIGIPSVMRKDTEPYLFDTVTSIIETTWEDEKNETIVVIFLADYDESNNQYMQTQLIQQFAQYIESGFLHIVQTRKTLYPQLTNLKRNYNDSPTRVIWRSKQVVDFAIMFTYCRQLARYHIQIEDDVDAAPNFIDSIKSFIITQNTKSPNWVLLEFSSLGFIGKLFRSSDLEQLAKFLLLFYSEQPVDWLFKYFMQTRTQSKVLQYFPSLFQHRGKHSSLKEKTNIKLNLLEDNNFDEGRKTLNGTNPPARILTTIKTYKRWRPEMAYAKTPGYFWGYNPDVGDTFYVIFEKDVVIKRVNIASGTKYYKNDTIHHGLGEVAPKIISKPGENIECTGFKHICEFYKGSCISKSNLYNSIPLTKCLKISITKAHNKWIIIREIAIYT